MPPWQRPPETPALDDLRKEIDRIDEAMHQLLMERGEIIDRLIAVKRSQETRLGVPPGARGRDDAPAGQAAQRHPAARHRREHLARHHFDLHLRAGAVFGACRPVGGRRLDARFRPLSFRLHGAVRGAYGRRRGGGGGVDLERRSRPGAGASPCRAPAPGGARSNSTPRPRSSRACPSSSAPTTRPPCRSSCFRGSPPTPWRRKRRCGACASPAGARGAAQALSTLADFIAVPDRAFDGAALLITLPSGVSLEAISAALVKAGATVRSAALVGSHATRYTVAAEK